MGTVRVLMDSEADSAAAYIEVHVATDNNDHKPGLTLTIPSRLREEFNAPPISQMAITSSILELYALKKAIEIALKDVDWYEETGMEESSEEFQEDIMNLIGTPETNMKIRYYWLDDKCFEE